MLCPMVSSAVWWFHHRATRPIPGVTIGLMRPAGDGADGHAHS
jgi:hypothetical protein